MKDRNVKVNMALNAFKSALSVVFPLITYPYISRCLGVTNIGKFNFANSIMSYFILIAGLGISTYAIRQGAQIRDNREKINNFASEIFTINLLSTIVSYAALFILMFFSSRLQSYRSLLAVLSISMAFTLVGKEWICQIYEDYFYLTVRYIIFQLISLGLLFFLIHKPEDYVLYAGITVIASSGANIVNYFYTRRYCRIRLKINFTHLKPILILFASSIAVVIYTNSDTTILGLMCSDYEVGIYSVSVKIYNILVNIFNSAIIAAIPRISSLTALDDAKEQVGRLGSDLWGTLISILLPAAVGVIILSKQIVLLISTKDFLPAYVSLSILSLAMIFCVLGTFWGNGILIPYGQESKVLKATIIGAILNVVLNIILIPIGQQNAAALTTLVAQFASFMYCYVFGRKYVSMPGMTIITLKSIIGCVAIVAIGFAFNHLNINLYTHIIAVVILSVIAYTLIEITLKNASVIAIFKKVRIKIVHR